jgi:hypothetical protein
MVAEHWAHWSAKTFKSYVCVIAFAVKMELLNYITPTFWLLDTGEDLKCTLLEFTFSYISPSFQPATVFMDPSWLSSMLNDLPSFTDISNLTYAQNVSYIAGFYDLIYLRLFRRVFFFWRGWRLRAWHTTDKLSTTELYPLP